MTREIIISVALWFSVSQSDSGVRCFLTSESQSSCVNSCFFNFHDLFRYLTIIVQKFGHLLTLVLRRTGTGKAFISNFLFS